LAAFSVGPDGRLSAQRTFGELPRGTWADGICLDAEGAVRVADPKGRHCYRVAPAGVIAQVIDTGLPAVACALGGADRRTRFVTRGLIRPWTESEADRLGDVVSYDVDVAGAGWP
jgi:sugar lactone lactonase YvrE